MIKYRCYQSKDFQFICRERFISSEDDLILFRLYLDNIKKYCKFVTKQSKLYFVLQACLYQRWFK